jgi:hypothetical protein
MTSQMKNLQQTILSHPELNNKDGSTVPARFLQFDNYTTQGYSLKKMKLTFIEVPAFINQIDKLGKPQSVEILVAIQNDLLKDPKRGDVIEGAGGARKGCISNPSKGKGKAAVFDTSTSISR